MPWLRCAASSSGRRFSKLKPPTRRAKFSAQDIDASQRRVIF